MKLEQRLKGCITLGAIGDALGSRYENVKEEDNEIFYPFGKPPIVELPFQITDDTQFTIATCEAIIEDQNLAPEAFARKFLEFYKQKKFSGIGSSTLKALRELNVGGHWSQVGRRGEYAAGNGAAMRVAPLAYAGKIDRKRIREICSITHNNDEAYIGSLAIYIAIKEILNGNWKGDKNLIEIIIDQIPDTLVRDKLIEINSKSHLSLYEIGQLGNNGYVVNSVPLVIAAANRFKEFGVANLFDELIRIGGDTDSNCSMTGQILGSLIGFESIPNELTTIFDNLHESKWINEIINEFIKKRKDWT